MRPLLWLWLASILGGCADSPQPAPGQVAAENKDIVDTEGSRRMRMVDEQLRSRGIRDRRVLEAMERVPRHLFVDAPYTVEAYGDFPLPIGHGQTISQPYIVGYMTEALDPDPGDTILEIGTGSGYQAAVLSEIVKEVYSIEIVPELGQRAAQLLEKNGYANVQVRIGDGYRGWPEKAPFDGIIVTAAPDHVPQPLVDQLAVGGKLVIPVGDFFQEMMILTRTSEGVIEKRSLAVTFVPMTGEARERR